MPKTFDCPKCGAPVAFQSSSELSAARPTVRCDYCHSQLIAPDELAGKPARVVRIQFTAVQVASFRKWAWALLAIPLFALVIVGLAALGILAPAIYSVSRTVKEPTTSSRPNTPRKESTNSFASELLAFGSEGIGPGMFTDARSIAVDGAGRIYVGEYTAGEFKSSIPAASSLLSGTSAIEKHSCAGLPRIERARFTSRRAAARKVIAAKPERSSVSWSTNDRVSMT